ncbi:MAG: M24 family metallopeptidase [Meiothermus sp.]|nr:M24 family metallopeptidase [Meiothermus sp.]
MNAKKLAEVQDFLLGHGLQGWLVCDFRGANPFAARVLGLGEGIFTRRWFLWVPARGEPRLLIHDIEALSFRGLGLELTGYNGRESLRAGLGKLLGRAKRIAMEYSPENNNPYVSRVDAGTVELVRGYGLEVVSSGDLLQLFPTWNASQLAHHRKAAKVLAGVKDAAFALLRERVAGHVPITEHELQSFMLNLLHQQGMETDHAPTVAFGDRVGVGHYSPSAGDPRALEPGPVLLDLWCKAPGDNPYADIAWMAYWGTPGEEFSRAFAAALAARDLAVEFLQARFASSQQVLGYEVDRLVRQSLAEAGFGGRMRRRTGHSLGTAAVHGEAAHFDDFETLDDRAVLPRLGYTLEPGFPLSRYGVHTEINVYTHKNRVEVTTPVQRELIRLG